MTHSACVVAVVRGSSEASRASEYDPTGTSAGTHGHDIVQSQSTVTSASGVVDIPQARGSDRLHCHLRAPIHWLKCDRYDATGVCETRTSSDQFGIDFKRIQCHPHYADQLSGTEGDSSTTQHRTNHLPPVYQTLSPPQSTVQTIYRQSTKHSVHHKAPYKPFTASLPNTQSTTKHRTNHLPPVYQTFSPPQSTVRTIYRQSTKLSVHHKAPYEPFTASLPNSQSTTKHRSHHLPPVYQTLSPPQSTVHTIYRQSTKLSVHHKAPYKPFTASQPKHI